MHKDFAVQFFTLKPNGAIVMSLSPNEVINHMPKFAFGYKLKFLLLPRLLFGLCC